VTFADAHNSKALVSSYAPSSPGPACCNIPVESALLSPTYLATHSSDNILLPPTLIQALQKAIPTTNGGAPFGLVVADTGATDHMVPDRGAFISYKSVYGLQVHMGNNSFHRSLVVGWQSFPLMVSNFSFAMCYMSQTFESPSTVYVPIFVSWDAVLWEATRLACTFTSQAWS
jgi:hypothetical protein